MALRILLALALCVPSIALMAQEPPVPNVAEGDQQKADKSGEGDFYQVPESDPTQLREFIIKMLSFQPKTRKEAVTHQAKAIGAVREAATKMLKVVEDKKSINYLMAESVLLQIDIQDARVNQEADAKPVVKRTLEFVKKIGKDASGMEAELLFMLGGALEPVAARKDLAVKVYSEGGKMLSEAAPRPDDTVLVVENGASYLAELIRPLVASVETMSAQDAAGSSSGRKTYSLIIIDGAVEELSPTVKKRLAEGGRIVTGLVERGVTRLASGKKVAGTITLQPIAEIGSPVLDMFAKPESWSF